MRKTTIRYSLVAVLVMLMISPVATAEKPGGNIITAHTG